MAKYLNVNYSDGKMFEYSKDKKDGFDSNFNAKGELKGFRKYQDNIVGEFVSVTESKNPHLNNQSELTLTVKENEEFVNIKFSTEKQSGDYSDFAESLIRHLPNLVKGTTYTVMFYSFTPDGKTRKSTGVSFKTTDGDKVDKLTQSAVYKDGTKVDGDIPAVTWRSVKGKPTPNTEEQQTYLYDVLMKYVSESPQQQTTTETPKPSAKEPVKNVPVTVDEYDDLPF